MNAIPLKGRAVPTHFERRDLRARAGRDEVARILELPPRRLGQLSAEVVEAMRDQLTRRERRALDQARLDMGIVIQRATAIVDGLLAIDDRAGAALAAELLHSACGFQEHLEEVSRNGLR